MSESQRVSWSAGVRLSRQRDDGLAWEQAERRAQGAFVATDEAAQREWK